MDDPQAFARLTRVNLNIDLNDEDEKRRRKEFRALEPPPSTNKDPTIYTYNHALFSFNLKKPSWDAKGAIEGQLGEEDMRQRFFYPFLKPGSVFYDIGACHGSWTFPALALGATVYAFEPDPRFHESISNSCAVNPGFAHRLKLFENALANKEVVGQLLELEEVVFKTLDNIVRELEAPSYIKIDVEGLEKHVLKGAVETIARYKPRIFVENHLGKEGEEEIKNFLSGFRCVSGRKEKSFSYLFFEPKIQ